MDQSDENSPLIHKSVNYDVQFEVEPKRPETKQRLQSLDVFRGLTIVGMILVDNQAGGHVYWPLAESQWEGLRPSDCVFPSFLFIVGVAIALALRKENPKHLRTWIRILRRTLVLFVIGVFFNLFATRFRFSGWRIPGVLQRIAICYMIVSILYLTLPFVLQWLVVIGFVVLYLILMYRFEVPGCGRGILTPQCNAGAYIDQRVFGKGWMLWPNDPEGILSTATSILTTFIGYNYGITLVTFHRNPNEVIPLWFILNGLFIGPALITCTFIPLIKKIWTLSFALTTAGIAGIILTLIFILVDAIDWSRFPFGSKIFTIIIAPLLWLGTNSLLIFMAMILFEIILLDIIFVPAENNSSVSLWTWLFRNAYASWITGPYVASLIFSFTHLLLWIGVAGFCYRRKWFLKI
jgi:predicted acyltransferase